MTEVSILNKLHKWQLVSDELDENSFKQYTCLNCKMKAKKKDGCKYFTLDDCYSRHQIDGCNVREDKYLGQLIQITEIKQQAVFIFENCKPKSIHKIVTPLIPDYKNGDRGVWIDGVGAKVKLAWDEFHFVDSNIIILEKQQQAFKRTKLVTKNFKRTKK